MEMQKDSRKETSRTTASERASTSPRYSMAGNQSSQQSLTFFNTTIPRIAILGAGGMGKTSLARAVLHQAEIAARYAQNSLLILDELETLWEPTNSRGNIEELLSLLTGVEDLALIITMRGAERPAKVQWTRPFLRALQPLDRQAARLTFADIADSGHNVVEVDQILSLTDNMPLAISLLAHLADTEGCPTVLSRWEKEKTSLISEGFDKRSNLDMSISLSLLSPRIQFLPQSQELLSLLSMLPDGLADVDLIQSKLPLDNILECETALKSTALAYSDEHKRLKVLMPIQEYLQQYQPPRDHLVHSVFQYFEEMLKFYREYSGTQSNSKIVPQIKSHFTNIQNVLQMGSKTETTNPIEKHLLFASMQILTLLIGQVQDILPQLYDHRLKAYFIIQLLNEMGAYQNSDFEALAFLALEHLKHFDDPDLKCRLYNIMAFYWRLKTDLVEAANMCKKCISLAIPTGNRKRHSQALNQLAWIHVQLGKYSLAQMYAYEAQKLARVSGDLYKEAEAIQTQAMSWQDLGHYKQSLSLCISAQSLLDLCGMSGSEANISVMNTQAEVHKCKSEYREAWKIHTKIIQISADRSPNHLAYALLNVAETEVLMDVPKPDVQRKIDLARSTHHYTSSISASSDCTLGHLHLREKDFSAAQLLFEKVLQRDSSAEIQSLCLEGLGNANQWGANYSMFRWTTIFLVHSIKGKQRLQVLKALQFCGDTFLDEQDEDTAITLFTVALEGFTCMDVHQSRAECMLRLGDIANSHGDWLKAVELWMTARPLFERSSQAKQVQCLDERLACIENDVLEQCKENITRLVELNIPSGNPCDIEDEEQVELSDEPHEQVVV
ncbi:hypothetical protein B0H14DRAFT_3167970 [Mycena olivaceomarginata]|nr:hypothetical protein B0H14DRAFT_3167970 [Mycena olivaceomarginata]